MKKINAKIILSLPDELLIKYWEKNQTEQYLDLLKTMPKEEVVKHVKKLCRDIVEEKPTVFVSGEKIKIEYLGEEE